MKPLTDEELILYYYGESADADEIEQRLESSPESQQQLAALKRLLNAVDESPVPERSAGYGSVVWRQLAPRLEKKRSLAWSWELFRPRREWALAGAMMLLLVVAFFSGWLWPRQGSDQVAGLSSEGRERILLMTVANHLERSEMLLLELVNVAEDGEVDLSIERQLAGELRDESRLYRLAASQAGKPDVAALLEQLEVVLVELANGPEAVSSTDLGELRLRLDEGDILFKVRVVGSRLRQETRTNNRSRGPEQTPRDL